MPFVAIGAAGLWQLRRDPAIDVLFLGILLTGFGSAYYHLNPNDRTLFWDRLPMAVSFMAILANAIEERVDAKAGAILLWPLVAVGVFSILLWRWTGDLRLYGWVQFFPGLALPLLFVLFPPQYSGTSDWLFAAALYALAKVFEFYDHAIFVRHHQWSYSQAHRRSRRLFRDPETFPDAPADHGCASQNQLTINRCTE